MPQTLTDVVALIKKSTSLTSRLMRKSASTQVSVDHINEDGEPRLDLPLGVKGTITFNYFEFGDSILPIGEPTFTMSGLDPREHLRYCGEWTFHFTMDGPGDTKKIVFYRDGRCCSAITY